MAGISFSRISAIAIPKAMLHIRSLAGEELVKVPLGEVSEVRELKRHLHRLHNLPVRFRQRLFFCGSLLDDDAKLDAPMDLDLLLLPLGSPVPGSFCWLSWLS